jgi:trehalose-6-phosphate synthase
MMKRFKNTKVSTLRQHGSVVATARSLSQQRTGTVTGIADTTNKEDAQKEEMKRNGHHGKYSRSKTDSNTSQQQQIL